MVLGWLPPIAHAAPPPRLALVIGNSAYTDAPPLPACATSARLVAQAMEARGYTVFLRQDLSHGQMAATFRAFSQALAQAPGAEAVAYVCARAVAFEGRPFLLPVSARVQRPSDAISQGILLGHLTDALDQPNGGEALMLLDAMPGPAGDTAVWLQGLGRAGGRTTAAVALPAAAPEAGPAPLAGSLDATLAPDAEMPLASLSVALRQHLGPLSGLTLALHPPTDDQPARTAAGPARALAAAPPQEPAPEPAPAEEAVPPPPPPPEPPSPDVGKPQRELPISPAQRRFVQGVLQRLGYYDGPLDGIFGHRARVAIRRYQREAGAAPTGVLTPEQARRLLATQPAEAT
nr:peptidoglycan-binding protein [Roseomonas marmotae]